MAAPSSSSETSNTTDASQPRKSALSRLGKKMEMLPQVERVKRQGPRDLRQTLSRGTGSRLYHFSTLNNVVVERAAIAEKRHPSPELEHLRAAMLETLGKKFQSFCKDRLEIEAPMHALARWYYDQLSIAASQFAVDPLLRYPESAVESELLSRELLQEIPCRLPGRAFRDWTMGIRFISTYVQRAEHWKGVVMLNNRGMEDVAAELEAAVGPILAEAKVWVDEKQYDDNATEDELRAMLVKLRDVCSPVFRSFSKAEVETVCREMATAAEDIVVELQHHAAALLKEQADLVATLDAQVTAAVAAAMKPAAPVTDAPVTDAPVTDAPATDAPATDVPATNSLGVEEGAVDDEEAIQARLASVRQAVATVLAQHRGDRPMLIAEPRGNGFRLVYRDHSISLKRESVAKLRELYNIHNVGQDPHGIHFLSVLYCCLCRYKMLGASQTMADFEMALPPAFLTALTDHLEVCFEAFASPANTFFRNFCSGCPDVDVFFGSVGSFFEFEPESGSFEVFPPFVEEVLDKLAIYLLQLLTDGTGALSFVVVMPEWRNPPLPALDLLESSRWLRAHFPVSGRRQGMVSGTALGADPQESWRHLAFADFHVYVLQNDMAAKRWPLTDAKLLHLKRALGQTM